MQYLYTALQLAGAFGGQVFCLYSIAFRWTAVTRKYGHIDLYFWVIYVSTLSFALSVAATYAVWGVEVAIWYLQNPS